jgi:hypothetical protein
MPTVSLDRLGSETVDALNGAWAGFIGFIDNLVGALIVLIIGWIIAIALGRLATQILKAFRIDNAVEKIGGKGAFRKAGYKFNVAQLVGGLVRWFFIIVFIMAASEVLGLPQVTSFLSQVLLYVPNIIAAVAVLLIGVLIANFLSVLVKGSVKVAGLASSDVLATITRWSILIFSLLIALDQLGVGSSVIDNLVIGFVAMLAIAGGLAFGLGGKDQAGAFLRKLQKEMQED